MCNGDDVLPWVPVWAVHRRLMEKPPIFRGTSVVMLRQRLYLGAFRRADLVIPLRTPSRTTTATRNASDYEERTRRQPSISW